MTTSNKQNKKHKYEIIMPMAGSGERFRRAGFVCPKPLLPLGDTVFFSRALASLSPILQDCRVTFVVCTEDKLETVISDKMTGESLLFQIISLEKRTTGPAETTLLAAKSINNDLPLFILDCDFYLESPAYFQKMNALDSDQSEPAGIVPYFNSANERYSFIETDAQDKIINIEEKRAISDKAVAGLYFFSKAGLFFEAADILLNARRPGNNAEIYVSHCIKYLLGKNVRFYGRPVQKYVSFGTPEEYEQAREYFQLKAKR